MEQETLHRNPYYSGGDQSPLNDLDDMEPEAEPELDPLDEEHGIDEPD